MNRKLYCCSTDWLHEVGEAPDLEGKMPLFSSVEKLMAAKPCWSECGILEIDGNLVRWVNSGDIGWQIAQVSKKLGVLEDEEK